MSTEVRRAIYGKLAGDTTLNSLLGPPPAGWAHSIYHEPAPATAAFPYVVFSKSSGVPTQAFHDPSAFETDVWQVKAIDQESRGGPTSASANVEAIAARVKLLLNDAVLSISSATFMSLRRQSDVEYPEQAEGIVYKHCGALYRLTYDPN